MVGERRERILGLLGGRDAPSLETKRLCQVCTEVTGMTGAGIMLMSGDVPRGSVCTTDAVSDLIEQLRYELGEGLASTRTTPTNRCSNLIWSTRAQPDGSRSPGRPSPLGCGRCSGSRSKSARSGWGPSTSTAIARGR